MILKIIKAEYVNKEIGPDEKRNQVTTSIRRIECNDIEEETSNIGTPEAPNIVTNYSLEQETDAHKDVAVRHGNLEDAPQPSVYLTENNGDTISKLM